MKYIYKNFLVFIIILTIKDLKGELFQGNLILSLLYLKIIE